MRFNRWLACVASCCEISSLDPPHCGKSTVVFLGGWGCARCPPGAVLCCAVLVSPVLRGGRDANKRSLVFSIRLVERAHSTAASLSGQSPYTIPCSPCNLRCTIPDVPVRCGTEARLAHCHHALVSDGREATHTTVGDPWWWAPTVRGAGNVHGIPANAQPPRAWLLGASERGFGLLPQLAEPGSLVGDND